MIIASAQYHRNTGLGNKLFPWSRAKIFSLENSCKMLEPVWVSPRGAAIVRGGINYQKALSKIWLYNNFINDEGSISRLQYLINYKGLKKKYFDSLHDARNSIISDGHHYIFRWNPQHNFMDLQGYQTVLLQNLFDITASSHKKFSLQFKNKEFIGLNIRTGKDFISKSSGKAGHYKTELNWFIHALKKARSIYGDLPAIIVSDGGDNELAPLLKLEKTTLLNSSSAISDLLVLTYSKILLGSGNSSFSAWASFLGGMDTYSSPETSYDGYFINSLRLTSQKVSVL